MKVICVYNQKGGVGKTTTVVNLAAALGKKKKILVLDLDPQGNATSGLGIEKSTLQGSVYDLMLGEGKLSDYCVKTGAPGVDLIPSVPALAGVEIELIDYKNREHIVRAFLENLSGYDYVLIDCPPSLGLLSLNALAAADSVIIPIQCEYYALEGVGQLMETIELVRRGINPKLEVEGVVLSMFDGRNNLSLQVVEEVKSFFKKKVFKSMIPRNIRLAEAPSHGLSVLEYDPKSKGAKAYEALAKEFLRGGR